MSDTFTCLLTHFIFSTKEREPWITDRIRERLYAYIGGIVREERGVLSAAGGVSDHVHLLISLHPATAPSHIMQLVKANSSRWVHETYPDLGAFAWQRGYAGFSVSLSNADSVRAYIAGQEAHHARKSFKEELIEFLTRHGIEFDERFLE